MSSSRFSTFFVCGLLAVVVVAAGCSKQGAGAAKSRGEKAARAPAKSPAMTPRPAPQPRKRRPPPCPAAVKASLAEAAKHGNDRPIVKVEDPTGNLEHFTRAWMDVLLGKRKKVRVALFGDSNNTLDWSSGYLRKFWAKQLGAGGHGFVAAGPMVSWYQHREIRTAKHRHWKSYAVTMPPSPWKHYGHGGTAGVGNHWDEAVTWESSTDEKSLSKEDAAFSRFEIHYRCDRYGGTFLLFVDGKQVSKVDTRCKKLQYGIFKMRVTPGHHKVKVVARRPMVTLYGAVFENDRPGIVVDGLGIGALNFYKMLDIERQVFSDGLRARKYDLVILTTGTTMWSKPMHFRWARRLIKRIRAALGPKISILIFSPPPFGKRYAGTIVGHKRMPECAKEKRKIAREHKTAYWDYQAAIGGGAAMPDLVRRKLFHPDMVHLKPGLHELVMARFSRAMRSVFLAAAKRAGLRCK